MKEPGRERVKIAGPFQVSKLQTFARNQRSGKGTLARIQICLCRQPPRHHPARCCCGGAACPGDTAGASPMPPMPSAREGALPTWVNPNAQASCPRDAHAVCRLSWKEGCASAPGVGPHQGGMGVGSPPAPPDPLSPAFPNVVFNEHSCCLPPLRTSGTCTHTKAHSPEKANGFAPHHSPLVLQTAPWS